jgi:hypothetical protein
VLVCTTRGTARARSAPGAASAPGQFDCQVRRSVRSKADPRRTRALALPSSALMLAVTAACWMPGSLIAKRGTYIRQGCAVCKRDVLLGLAGTRWGGVARSPPLDVIASNAKQSSAAAPRERLDCFVARAPRNDVERPRNHRTPFEGGPPNVNAPTASTPRARPACPAAAPPAPDLPVRTASASPGSARYSCCGPGRAVPRSRANCRHSCPGW